MSPRPSGPSRTGRRFPATRGPGTSTPSPARCRSTAGSSPCSRPSTTASRSGRRATSTSRSSARHFYYHAGWAQLDVRRARPATRRSASCGQIIPWNFPLLMLAWKIAPALAMGNTVVLKPAESTPLTALLFAEICARGGPAARASSTSSPATGETGAALVDHPGVDKIAFTGSTEVGRLIREATAGTRQEALARARRQGAVHRLRRRRPRQAVEGIVDAIWFNQGQVCCAGSRLLVQESVAERLHREAASARMETLRVGDPLDKTTDIGAIVAPVQLREASRELVKQGVAEGATLWQPSCALPDGGLLLPADALHRTSRPPSTVAQEEIFGPVLVAHDLPHARRGGREGQQHAATASPRASGARTSTSPSTWRRKLKAGVVWVNTHQPVRRRRGLRRLPGDRLRPRGRARGALRVRAHARGRRRSRGPRAAPGRRARRRPRPTRGLPPIDRTAKLFIGGKQARPDSGYSRNGARPEGHACSARWARATARTSATPSRPPTPRRAGRTSTAHNRAQVLYYIAENLAARARRSSPRASRG